MNQSLSYEILQVMPLAVGSGLFVSLASFSQPDQTQGPTGNLIGTFSPVSGLQNIPAMNVPYSIRTVAADEMKKLSEIEAAQFQHVLLSGCYPQIKSAAGQGWRVKVDGILFDLLGADIDSQSTQTRCRVQKVDL